MGPNTIAKVGIWSHSKQSSASLVYENESYKNFFIQSESSEQEPQQQSHTHTHIYTSTSSLRPPLFVFWRLRPFSLLEAAEYRQLYSYYQAFTGI